MPTHFDPGSERYVSLATYRRSGVEVRTPVWVAGAGDCYYAFSAGNAGKVKRLRNNSRIRLAASDIRGNVHSEWRDGEARVVTDANTIATARAAMRSKYGYQIRFTDFFARLTGRMNKRAYIKITLLD